MKPHPFTVVIAGRANVGKSALFNRLVRRRRSLVHDLPGMTRDVVEAEAALADGRSYRLLDTGGYDPEERDQIPVEVRERAVAAMQDAHLIVLVVDASAGILSGDLAAARAARATGVETIVAANKIDRKAGSEGELEAWALGFGEVHGVSAEHGTGVDELADAIGARLRALPETAQAPADAARPVALAIVGRPNVGKSSVLNALLREERAIVSDKPGTTRDSVDALLRDGDRVFRIVDTAGIRRKGRTERGPEVLSVVQARKRIEECDVALFVLDAREGPSSQDASIASYVHDAGKGLVIIGNKWDLASERGEGSAKELRLAVAERIPFARYAPLLLTSAKSGRGLSRVLAAADAVAQNRRRRISTGELNRVLGRALRDKPPRAASGRRLKVFYVAQTGTGPPAFTLVADHEEPLHFSEARRIENLLREAADFSGSPVRIWVRARSRRDDESRGRARGRWSRVKAR